MLSQENGVHMQSRYTTLMKYPYVIRKILPVVITVVTAILVYGMLGANSQRTSRIYSSKAITFYISLLLML